MEEKNILLAEKLRAYAGTFHLNKKQKVSCYTKKQLHKKYPEGGYRILGEFSKCKKCRKRGEFKVDGQVLPFYQYRSTNRFSYKEKGYLKCEEKDETYIALLKNVLLKRILLIVLCLAIIFGGCYVAFNWKTISPAIPELIPDIDPGATDQIPSSAEDSSAPAGIKVPGYKSITIPANTQNVEVSFQNPEGNPCYFVVSLVLSDGTQLYQSKMIPPGTGIYEITLQKPLAPGNYDAAVKYETFSLDELKPMNGANINITLVAQ